MSTIVWTTLITAVATVTGSLGAIWLKGLYDDRAQAWQAEQSRSAAREDQQRQAYGELVKTARLALRNFRQLLLFYETDMLSIKAAEDAANQADGLAGDMSQADAIAELVGSPAGRQYARAVYDKARACFDFFLSREFLVAPAQNPGAGEVLGDAPPARTEVATASQAGKSKALCDELAVAIDQFIEAVNAELAQ